MVCAFCLKHKEFVESHIIPKAMYALGEEKSMRVRVKAFPSDTSKHIKKVPSGIYCKFLCRECEDHFMVIDDYTIKFLQTELKASQRSSRFIILPNIDGKKIALFFMSVLWRGHHAKHEFFGTVNLGIHEKGLLNVISQNDSNCDIRYSVILQRINTTESINGFLNPYFGKHLGGVNVNHYVVSIPLFRAFIKVDKRPWPSDLHDFTLNKNNEVGFFLQELQNFKELKVMRDIIKKRAHDLGQLSFE
jgi:hypothetical protein